MRAISCRLHDVLYRPGEVILTLEYLDCNLRELLRNTGALSLILVKSFTHQMLQGLAYAKAKRCMHRDLKPANVLVLPRQGIVKIADFGLGRAHDFGGGRYTRQVRRVVSAAVPRCFVFRLCSPHSLDTVDFVPHLRRVFAGEAEPTPGNGLHAGATGPDVSLGTASGFGARDTLRL
jgi:serine/threonine protein kinase